MRPVMVEVSFRAAIPYAAYKENDDFLNSLEGGFEANVRKIFILAECSFVMETSNVAPSAREELASEVCTTLSQATGYNHSKVRILKVIPHHP